MHKLLLLLLPAVLAGAGPGSGDDDLLLVLPIQLAAGRPSLMMRLRGSNTIDSDVDTFAKQHGVLHAVGQLKAAARPRIEATLRFMKNPVQHRVQIVVKSAKIVALETQGVLFVVGLGEPDCGSWLGALGLCQHSGFQDARTWISSFQDAFHNI